LVSLLPGAALGLGLEARRRFLSAATAGWSVVAPVGSFLSSRPPMRAPMKAARAGLDRWHQRGTAQMRRDMDATLEAGREITPDLVSTALSWVGPRPLADLVERILPLVRAEALVPLVQRMLDELPPEQILSLVERLMSQLDRARVDRLADRMFEVVDVNGIVARVNVKDLMQELDIPELTRELMEEIDLGEIIRESMGSVSAETRDVLRVRGVQADRRISRVVDRILLRSGERDIAIPAGDADNGDAPMDGSTPPRP
jgi:hypothetical protein